MECQMTQIDEVARDLYRISVYAEAFDLQFNHFLVRDEELSYKDAAARLGVAVGTVHTQLSRANALLRECIQRYQAGTGT